jgi:hypothetical protein
VGPPLLALPVASGPQQAAQSPVLGLQPEQRLLERWHHSGKLHRCWVLLLLRLVARQPKERLLLLEPANQSQAHPASVNRTAAKQAWKHAHM